MASVSLQNILKYAEITPNSRNLIEAERLLKSEFVITFGATKITENSLDILALCLKTSGMKETPHTIKACPTSALALAIKGAKRKQADSERQNEIQLSKRFNHDESANLKEKIENIFDEEMLFTLSDPDMPLDLKYIKCLDY